jgi:hypothetical protein
MAPLLAAVARRHAVRAFLVPMAAYDPVALHALARVRSVLEPSPADA